MDPPVIRANYLLRFTTPTMIAGIDVLLGAGGHRVQHKKLFRSERAAEGRLDGCWIRLVRVNQFVRHFKFSSRGSALATFRFQDYKFQVSSFQVSSYRFVMEVKPETRNLKPET
jgi:hypothetical protein